jgi:hypothetical protein
MLPSWASFISRFVAYFVSASAGLIYMFRMYAGSASEFAAFGLITFATTATLSGLCYAKASILPDSERPISPGFLVLNRDVRPRVRSKVLHGIKSDSDPVSQAPQREEPQLPVDGATNQLVARFSRLYAEVYQAGRTGSSIGGVAKRVWQTQ